MTNKKTSTVQKTLKNALIINGTVYLAKRALYTPFGMENVCTKCDLREKCEDARNIFCEPFEKKGYVSYFKKQK